MTIVQFPAFISNCLATVKNMSGNKTNPTSPAGEDLAGMFRHVCVYGPSGCGKTRNGGKILDYLSRAEFRRSEPEAWVLRECDDEREIESYLRGARTSVPCDNVRVLFLSLVPYSKDICEKHSVRNVRFYRAMDAIAEWKESAQ